MQSHALPQPIFGSRAKASALGLTTIVVLVVDADVAGPVFDLEHLQQRR